MGSTAERGAQALIQTVEQRLGLPINHFVAIDPDGLAALVDQVGGVRVQVDQQVQDAQTGLVLTPGCHSLDGQTALALARSRELRVQDASGRWTYLEGADLQREADQQVLVATIGRRLLTLSPSPSTLATLLGVFADHTTVDTGFGLGELTSLATWGGGLSADDLTTQTLPVTPFVRNGEDVLLPQPAVELPVDSPPISPPVRGVAGFLAPSSSASKGPSGVSAGPGGSTTTTSPPGTSPVFTPCG